MPTHSSSSSSFAASIKLTDSSWKLACLKAMGLDEWLIVDRDANEGGGGGGNNDAKPSREPLQILNLLDWVDDDDHDDDDPVKHDDPWMETAIQIQLNIRAMMAWIRQKQFEYVSLDIAEGEASLIQTTVTSFTATTANEIESLHQCVSSMKKESAQKQQHCAGIVQILMTELKEGIAEPFGQLSKQRNRAAVQIWQQPLQCRLWAPRQRPQRNQPAGGNKGRDATLELLGLDDDDDGGEHGENVRKAVDQRFQATRPSHRLHRDFLQSYEPKAAQVERPSILDRLLGSEKIDDSKFLNSTVTPSVATAPASTIPKKGTNRPEQYNDVDGDDDRAASAAALQQEAILLQAKTHSDLDSVQKMEQTMMDITSLLSQFADLVSEQQEDVWEIHDATISTKENLQKGQENLQDAKERTAASKHYMATGIAAMAVMLLLLNWLRS